METSALLSDNITQRPTSSRIGVVTWTTLAIMLFLFWGVFLFFLVLLLHAFFTIPHLREQPRYILFMYILVNNTIYLLTCMLLFLLLLFAYKIPAGGCYFLVVIATSTTYNTPNGLAVMAVERYVAICFPLRHSLICQVERSWVVVLVVSVIGIFPSVIDMLILSSTVDFKFFLQRVWCLRESFLVAPQQAKLRFSTDALSFAVVALIILYTYLKIIREAKKVGGDKASSSKASKTVMLHAIQLLLSLTSFTAALSEKLTGNQSFYIRFFNFFVFMVFPIFLIPLIYGVRDENFRKHVQMVFISPHHGRKTGGL